MGAGQAATLTGDYPLAAEAYLAAQAAWLGIGDTRAAARVWYPVGRLRWRQEAGAQALEAFQRSQELLGPGDNPAAAETLLQLADLHVTSLGRGAEALILVEQARAMVERLGDQRLQAAACLVLGNIKARTDDLQGGRVLLEQALALAQALDDPALGAETCAYLVNVYAWLGDLDRSRQFSLLRAELAQRTQDLFHLRHVYAWVGFNEAQQGHWHEAEHYFMRQAEIVEGLSSPEPRATLRAYRGAAHYFQGRFQAAEQEYRQAIDLIRPTGSGALVWFLGRQALILAELGRREEALAGLDELYGLAEAMSEKARARGFAFAHLAAGYHRLEARQQAAACYPKLLPFRGQLAPILIDRALGLAALANKDWAAAEQHLLEAEVAARRMALVPELMLTLLQRGLLERDHHPDNEPAPASAGGPLAEGLRLAGRLGMQALARQMLGEDDPQADLSPETRATRLSDRELEVLRLVAQGRTNREIAQVLVLSEKTVARHLTHIFTKLRVENRASAASYALRQGLA